MKFTPAFIWVLLFSCFRPGFTQAVWEKGTAINLTAEDRVPGILPMGKNGLAVYREVSRDEALGIKSWDISIYDAGLDLSWHRVISLDYGLEVSQQAWSGRYSYILFEGIKNLKRQVQVLCIDPAGQELKLFRISNFLPSFVFKFGAFRDVLVFAGFEKLKLSVVIYKFDDDRPMILQGLYSNKIRLLDLDIDPVNELITVLTSFKNQRGYSSIGLRSYDREGRSIENLNIEPVENKTLTDATSGIINGKYRLVAGLYRKRNSLFPDGIFFTTVAPDGKQSSRYYRFVTLFRDSLNSGAGRAPGKKNKNESSFDSDWSLGRITMIHGNPVLLAETYDRTEKGAMAPNILSDISYFYQTGYALFLEDTSRVKNYFTFDFGGMVNNRLRNHLFIVPSDTGAWFGFQDYDRIELMKISEDDIPKDTLAFSLPEISGLVTGHASFYHSESGFVSWFDRSFIYFCLKSEGNQDLEDRRTFCIEKINFR